MYWILNFSWKHLRKSLSFQKFVEANMNNKKRIHLKLSDTWTRFNGTEFVNVRNQHNFHIGDILKKEHQYFLITTNGLKAISEKHAHSKIIKMVQNINPDNLVEVNHSTRLHGRINKSKRKIIIAHNQTTGIFCYSNYNNLCIKTRIDATLYLSDENVKNLISIITERRNRLNQYTPIVFSPIVIDKAKKQLENLIKSDLHFEVNKNKLLIKSINGKTYTIDLNTGHVYSKNKRYICVATPQNLPLPDVILAKALTIVYHPRQISTL